MERERAAAAKLAADEAAAREAAEEARNARPWSDEEMGLLQKGVKLAKLCHTLLNGATSFHKGFPCFLPLHLWLLL